MNATHTPGPWIIEDGSVFAEDDGTCICSVEFTPAREGTAEEYLALESTWAEQKANANAIAAAPDMLAILYDWDVRLPPVLTHDDFQKCTVEISAGEVRRIRAAVAKALGEPHLPKQKGGEG